MHAWRPDKFLFRRDSKSSGGSQHLFTPRQRTASTPQALKTNSSRSSSLQQTNMHDDLTPVPVMVGDHSINGHILNLRTVQRRDFLAVNIDRVIRKDQNCGRALLYISEYIRQFQGDTFCPPAGSIDPEGTHQRFHQNATQAIRALSYILAEKDQFAGEKLAKVTVLKRLEKFATPDWYDMLCILLQGDAHGAAPTHPCFEDYVAFEKDRERFVTELSPLLPEDPQMEQNLQMIKRSNTLQGTSKGLVVVSSLNLTSIRLTPSVTSTISDVIRAARSEYHLREDIQVIVSRVDDKKLLPLKGSSTLSGLGLDPGGVLSLRLKIDWEEEWAC